MRRLAKTASYWCIHISVATLLTWLLTGNLAAALAVGLLEPTVQAFVFFVHDWLWERDWHAAGGADEPRAQMARQG